MSLRNLAALKVQMMGKQVICETLRFYSLTHLKKQETMLQAHKLALVYFNQNGKPKSIILHLILTVFQELLVQIRLKEI